MNHLTKTISALFIFALFSIAVHAHNKVVVIPTGGDSSAPQFRIVPWGSAATETNRGRLEYTADPDPTPQSTWGTVCDTCFAGNVNCVVDTPSKNAAATAVCMDLGYPLGFVDTSYGNTGSLPPILDEVRCPDGADSFKDCTSSTPALCTSANQVGVNCTLDAKTVFITSTPYNADLVSAANALTGGTLFGPTDGLAAGDALCQSRADAARLPGTYKAWLSDSTGSPSTRFTKSSVPYIRVDGALIALDWADLVDDLIQTGIAIDEFGSSVGSSIYYWTDTRATGLMKSSAYHCDGWTTVNHIDKGSLGRAIRIGTGWTDDAFHFCDSSSRLACFQQ